MKHFFLQPVYFGLVSFSLLLFLYFGFKHISFILQASTFTSSELIIFNLKLKVHKLSFLIFIF